jgi:hypothetical protein
MGKLLKLFTILSLIVLICVVQTSGLELSASAGGNAGRSTTMVAYGATIDDYANQHISLSPSSGTLANSYSGSGSLKKSTLSITDSKGNNAYVSRSITGKSGITKWSYDWSTSQISSPTYGSGVCAALSLTASDAYSIFGQGYAKNKQGDVAEASITAGSNSYGATSSLSNYEAYAQAFAKNVYADQAADYVASSGPINVEAHASSTIDKDYSSVDLDVFKGMITDLDFSANSGTDTPEQAQANFAEASGSSVDLSSHAENKALAREYTSSSVGTTYYNYLYGGADFEVQAKELTDTKITASATSSTVTITPTLPSSIKTAIMLEPFNKVVTLKGYPKAIDLSTTVFPELVSKGYATLRYTDSGATSDKFANLGSYNVVLVNSHMNSNVIGLSTGTGYISASDLHYDTSQKPLVILAGCDSFDGYPIKSNLANAVSGADLSGGYANSVGTAWNNAYLSYFFDSLGNGDTASQANTYAYKTATKKYGSGVYYLPLVLYGDTSFTL